MTRDIYAIDFGTTNSLLAHVDSSNNKQIIDLDLNSQNSSILRSIMYFPRESHPSFGNSAIEHYTNESGEGRFLRSIKKYLPIESFSGTNINNKFYSIEDLISRFLAEMKSIADNKIGKDVTEVILGRPAKFSENITLDELAQNRLYKAAELAGFKKIHFCPEPLAAAYEFKKTISNEKLLLVVDLGGGTSDFTVIKIHPGDYNPSDVLAIGGLSIAGNKLDGCIMGDKIAPHFGSDLKYQFPMSNNVLNMPASIKLNLMSPADIVLMSRKNIMKFLNEVKKCSLSDDDQLKLDNLFILISENLGFSIYEEIEKTKQEVCTRNNYEFNFLVDDIQVSEKYSYQQFLNSTKKNIDLIFNELDLVIKNAQVNYNDIDLICCTGGTSKVPEIKNRLEKLFGLEKIQTFKNFHSVIGGLAEQASHI